MQEGSGTAGCKQVWDSSTVELSSNPDHLWESFDTNMEMSCVVGKSRPGGQWRLSLRFCFTLCVG